MLVLNSLMTLFIMLVYARTNTTSLTSTIRMDAENVTAATLWLGPCRQSLEILLRSTLSIIEDSKPKILNLKHLMEQTLCKKLDIRYRIVCVYFEFTHQESHLRNEPVSHCAYFEYPQPHHVRLEGFTKQCLRIHFVTLCTVYGAGYALRFCSWYTSWILNLLQSKTCTYSNQYSTFILCSYRGKTPLLALQLAARVAQQSIATRQRESCASCWPA